MLECKIKKKYRKTRQQTQKRFNFSSNQSFLCKNAIFFVKKRCNFDKFITYCNINQIKEECVLTKRYRYVVTQSTKLSYKIKKRIRKILTIIVSLRPI